MRTIFLLLIFTLTHFWRLETGSWKLKINHFNFCACGAAQNYEWNLSDGNFRPNKLQNNSTVLSSLQKGAKPAENRSQKLIANSQQLVRQDLQRILADRRFSYPDYWAGWRRFIAKWRSWLARFQPRRRILKATWFDRLVKQIGLGLVLVTPFVLLYLARHYLTGENRLKATTANRTTPDADLTILLGQARQAAGRDDYRNAVRCLYLAALLQLRADGALPKSGNSGATDHENLRLLQKKLGAATPGFQAFNRLVRIFQEKWYGLKSCGPTDYQTAAQLFATIASITKSEG
jgi:hypothetical protein